jgi:hypothetical protein
LTFLNFINDSSARARRIEKRNRKQRKKEREKERGGGGRYLFIDMLFLVSLIYIIPSP